MSTLTKCIQTKSFNNNGPVHGLALKTLFENYIWYSISFWKAGLDNKDKKIISKELCDNDNLNANYVY